MIHLDTPQISLSLIHSTKENSKLMIVNFKERQKRVQSFKCFQSVFKFKGN